MQGWRSDMAADSGASRCTTVLRAVAAASILGILAAALQGCSSTSDTQLAQPSAAAQGRPFQQGQQQPWRQPSQFEADGPPSGTYRGGRDPVTGKAAEWSQNGPVTTSAITPLPSPGRPQSVARAAPQQSQPVSAGTGIGIVGTVKVRQGDTLESIARAHGITVTALMQANKMTSRSSIKAGQMLVVPQ